MEEIIATQYSFLGSQTLIKSARIEFETLIVDFVLTSAAAKDALQQALDTQQEVKVHYHKDRWLLSFCLPSGVYLVDSVEGVAKK